MNPPTTSIENLPPEMICELFKHLSLSDLAACSLVNKRWSSIYAGFKVRHLVVTGDTELIRGQWCYPVRKIADTERCQLSKFARLADRPLLSVLKHLSLSAQPSEFDLNKLNAFSQLMHLEINQHFGRESVHLNLPRLNVLVFHQPNYESPLSIDCPALSVLVYSERYHFSNLLDMKHPETIRELDTNMFGAKLAQFQNVDRLIARQFAIIGKDTLLSLPGLKELHYKVAISVLYDEDRSIDRLKRTLAAFMDYAKELRDSDFQFTFSGFRLTKAMLNQIDFARIKYVDFYLDNFYLDNYELFEPGALDFVHELNFRGGLPANILVDFHKKFTSIQHLHLQYPPPQDAAQMLRLLKSLSSLRHLFLRAKFGQQFYDGLPASVPLLTRFCLFACTESQLNFNFIGEFSYLKNLCIEHGFLEAIIPLVRQTFDKLDEVDFRFESFSILNERIPKSPRWLVFNDDERKTQCFAENSEQIVNFFEKILSGTS